MRFLSIHYLLLLWLLPILVLIFVVWLGRRRYRLEKLFNPTMQQLLDVRLHSGWFRFVLLLTGLAALIIALARPAFEEESVTVQRQGRDVVFLVDVSRSMLAEDLHPNRLERAKLAINDCVSLLAGDRVGLVAFGGSAKVICPLTLDYGFFSQTLNQLQAGMAVRGGTMIGDALRTVSSDVFDSQLKEYKDVVLITDGEDHESFPVRAAEAAGDEGVRLIIVGLGDENKGQPIPITDAQGNRTFLSYDGRQVLSRLDADTLRRMARATPGGRYLPVATGTIDLGEVYLDLIHADAKRQLAEESIERYDEKFQYALGLALVLLIGSVVLGRKAA